MCEQRWKQVVSSGVKRGHWTVEEDAVIVTAVNEQLTSLGIDPTQRTASIVCVDVKWADVSRELSGLRTAKQCRERYSNHLDPTLKKTAWSADEDVHLMKTQALLGNSWTKISQQMPGRSENEVKNRWYSVILRRYSDDLPFYQQQDRDIPAQPAEQPQDDRSNHSESAFKKIPPPAARPRKRKSEKDAPSPLSLAVPGAVPPKAPLSANAPPVSRYGLRAKRHKVRVNYDDSQGESESDAEDEVAQSAANEDSLSSVRAAARRVEQFLRDSQELLAAVKRSETRALSPRDLAMARFAEWHLSQACAVRRPLDLAAAEQWDQSLCSSALTTSSDCVSVEPWARRPFAVPVDAPPGGTWTTTTTSCGSPSQENDDELSIAAFLYSRFLGSNRTSAVCSSSSSSIDLPALAIASDPSHTKDDRAGFLLSSASAENLQLLLCDASQCSTPGWTSLGVTTDDI